MQGIHLVIYLQNGLIKRYHSGKCFYIVHCTKIYGTVCYQINESWRYVNEPYKDQFCLQGGICVTLRPIWRMFVYTWYHACILYTGLFLSHVSFSLLHLQTILPRLEFDQTKLCLKRNNLSQCSSPSLKLPKDKEGESSKNKTGENISLYTIFAKESHDYKCNVPV